MLNYTALTNNQNATSCERLNKLLTLDPRFRVASYWPLGFLSDVSRSTPFYSFNAVPSSKKDDYFSLSFFGGGGSRDGLESEK